MERPQSPGHETAAFGRVMISHTDALRLHMCRTTARSRYGQRQFGRISIANLTEPTKEARLFG
jgi:hypothetical protein